MRDKRIHLLLNELPHFDINAFQMKWKLISLTQKLQLSYYVNSITAKMRYHRLPLMNTYYTFIYLYLKQNEAIIILLQLLLYLMNKITKLSDYDK